MKSIRIIALFTLALFVFVPKISFALPAGSYVKSCYQCKVRNNKLRCICRQQNQRPRYTVLPSVRQCQFISNENGQLTCKIRRSRPLPYGSYRKSCVGCFYNGKRLSCRCRARSGDYWRRSSINNVRQCRQDIRNVNGSLRCRRDYQRPLPAGSYQRSCVSCRVTRRRLSCQCRTANQRYQQTTLRRPYRCLTIENLDGELSCVR